jgi:hypothetical protein
MMTSAAEALARSVKNSLRHCGGQQSQPPGSSSHGVSLVQRGAPATHSSALGDAIHAVTETRNRGFLSWVEDKIHRTRGFGVDENLALRVGGKPLRLEVSGELVRIA